MTKFCLLLFYSIIMGLQSYFSQISIVDFMKALANVPFKLKYFFTYGICKLLNFDLYGRLTN